MCDCLPYLLMILRLTGKCYKSTTWCDSHGASFHVCAVGKSAFGVYALRAALLQRPARHVVYLSEKTMGAWLFRASSSGDGHDVVPFHPINLRLLSELFDRRTVYISDSLRPFTAAAFTIMITSPKRNHEFYKSQPCELLLFPPFTWAEIQAMRGTCFPNASECVPSTCLAEAFHALCSRSRSRS